MLNNIYNPFRRAVLAELRDRARMANISKDAVQQQTMKVYVKLANNQNTYIFNLNELKKVVATENLLIQNDWLSAVEIGLAIHRVEKTSTGALLPGNTIPVNHPDVAIFGAPMARCLNTVYNGKLSIKTDQDVRLENFPTNELYRVGFAQTTANQRNSVEGLPTVTLDSVIEFSGKRANTFVVELGEGDYSTIQELPTALVENYLVITVSGFVTKNGAGSQEWLSSMAA